MAMSFAGRTAIAGIGATDFSKCSGRSTLRLAVEACDAALQDAGLAPGMIDGMITYTADDNPEIDLCRSLGIDRLTAGEVSAARFALVLLERLFLPLLGAALLFLAVAWRWGRIYCGWLCPHFSVVETINRAMTLASGRPSVWDRSPVPRRHPADAPGTT